MKILDVINVLDSFIKRETDDPTLAKFWAIRNIITETALKEIGIETNPYKVKNEDK